MVFGYGIVYILNYFVKFEKSFQMEKIDFVTGLLIVGLFTVLGGIGRIYLGVHYPSDTLMSLLFVRFSY